MSETRADYQAGAASKNGTGDAGPEAEGFTIDPDKLVCPWLLPEPPPRVFYVAGLVPENHITLMYGDGGMGKSYVAAYLGMCLAMGAKFGDRTTVQTPVLYVDYELDDQEFRRRLYALARGMDMDRPPEGLRYYKLEGPLTDRLALHKLLAYMKASQAKFFILDSLTISMFGGDPSAAPDVTAVMKTLEQRGTWLVIDHISKPPPGANLSHMRAFGSVFKTNIARSVLQVVQAAGGGLKIAQTKANFSAKAAPLYLDLDFKGDMVKVRFTDATDSALTGIEAHSSAADQVYIALAPLPDGKRTKEDIKTALEERGIHMSVGTIGNHLTTLHKAGRVEPDPQFTGQWFALLNYPPAPKPEETGKGTPMFDS